MIGRLIESLIDSSHFDSNHFWPGPNPPLWADELKRRQAVVDAAMAQMGGSAKNIEDEYDARQAAIEALGRIQTEEEAVAQMLMSAGVGAVPEAEVEEEVECKTEDGAAGGGAKKPKKKKKERTIPCPICLKLYSSEVMLKAHITRFHEQNNKVCKHCGKTFTSSVIMRKHVENVHKGIRYACDQVE